ncbi:prepilin peptidase [Lachnospira pectinoschiza]|uniref:Leader peptidase (Prepilin peptidase) / N-methyltransferase n=1 Tax=Lachnospira pectinoschiza TaxID=28052 RepID=A0A1G9Z7D6_9FIRM|nr:A24 family peptidase [Lachnospira pectinoschiza]SDN16995.1 leader peptidase (prepilin peptidase) / N-methyltransferase [Lachnospira pectinoschiza]
MQQEIYLYIIIFIYGLVIGSFINVLIYRLPKKEDIIIKASSCTNCGHRLQWYDLVPLLSYICLRGRCRYCGKKISLQYPIIELVNALLYLVIFLRFGFGIYGVLVSLFSSILLAIAVIDYKSYIIYDGLNIVLLVIAIINAIISINLADKFLGFIGVSGVMYLLVVIFRHFKNIDVFGGGDIKLMAAAGLFLGLKETVLAFFIACILGSVIHTIRMKLTNEGHILAFGPYLCLGIYISILFGKEIVAAYLGLFI